MKTSFNSTDYSLEMVILHSVFKRCAKNSKIPKVLELDSAPCSADLRRGCYDLFVALYRNRNSK